MRRRGPTALVAALLLAGCGGNAPPVTAPSPAASSPVAPTAVPPGGFVAAPAVRLPGADRTGTAQLSVRSSGIDRPFLLAPARTVVAGQPPALLVLLPAANTLLREEYDRYGIDAFRDRDFTVLVAGHDAASWNAGDCCGRPAEQQLDDVAAVTLMREEAVRLSGADADRTAVIGHSVGAFMAWRLACTPAFGAAAAVAVSGTLVTDCPELPRTPRFLSVSGALDQTVPVDGSERVVPILGIAPPSVREAVQRLAAAGGCAAPSPVPAVAAIVTDHGACTGGGVVRLEVVSQHGHTWADLDATRRVAAWLSASVAGVG